MGEYEKRLQEIDATLKRCVEHMTELYQEKEDILARMAEINDPSMQEM